MVMQNILNEIKIFLDNNIVNPTGIYIIIINLYELQNKNCTLPVKQSSYILLKTIVIEE